MKLFLLFLLYFSCSVRVNAQGFDLDQFYFSDATNSNLNSSSAQRVDSLFKHYITLNKITANVRKYKEFVFEYNYFLEQLNRSGRVFYENELSVYLNSLKDKILLGNNRNNSIQVFLLNATQLNAFTNDFGSIYVNIATVAKVKNETELLVIIAHEIAHVLHRHSHKMESLNDRFENEKFKSVSEIPVAKRHYYSRQHELEADTMAYQLLKKIGVDLTDAKGIFERLEFSANPVYNIPISITDGWGVSSQNLDYLDTLKNYTSNKKTVSEIIIDSLTTHPSIRQRKDLYSSMVGELIDSGEKLTQKFDHYKNLAAMVLLKSYITEGFHIEGLYLALQLQKMYPNNDYLGQNIAKLLMLITQAKYNEKISVINNFGNSCNDETYLKFRYALMHIPPLEFNIITLLTIKDYLDVNSTMYYERLYNISLQFFYKFNPFIFEMRDESFDIKRELQYDDISYAFSPSSQLTTEESQLSTTLKKQGFLLLENRVGNEKFVMNYLQNFDNKEVLTNAIKSYKKRRDLFESSLTLDQFIINYDVHIRSKTYKKGKHVAYDKISPKARVGLIQSDTYVFKKSKKKEFIIDFEKTLNLENKIANILNNEGLYDVFLSNQFAFGHDHITVQDNYKHYLLTTWMNETMNFTDLVYSVADEELLFSNSMDSLDYIVYNLNIIRKTGLRHRNMYYDIYFDVNTMGIAYMSSVSSKKRPSRNYLRHYFYQSYYGIKSEE